jgi:hypothetical protein
VKARKNRFFEKKRRKKLSLKAAGVGGVGDGVGGAGLNTGGAEFE